LAQEFCASVSCQFLRDSTMEPGEYEALVARASAGHASAATELLQSMRTHKIHHPEVVITHGGRLLNGNSRKLGGDLWTVLEQVFLASVELGLNNWRDYCLGELTKQFPNSHRVERLKGIYEESCERWSEAKSIYEKMIKEKPEDAASRKRLIALHKQRGRIPEAMKEMTEYLDTFSTDTEVWHELQELYIEAGSLQRAVFCSEELIMNNPHSMYHTLTYAELLYSTGDFELSRKYFSMACYLDGDSLRALWGLLMVNLQLADKEKGNEKMKQLQTFAIERLTVTYKNVGTHGEHALALLPTLTIG